MSVNNSLACVLLVCSSFFASSLAAAELETINVAPDQKGFILHPSGARFTPGDTTTPRSISWRGWPRNRRGRARVRRDEGRGHDRRADSSRVPAPDGRSGQGEARGRRAAQEAPQDRREIGIYLKITGLANYTIKDRAEWYDKLEEADALASAGLLLGNDRRRVRR